MTLSGTPLFSVRPATRDDAGDYARLIVLSGELLTRLWRDRTGELMQYLFAFPDTIYGYHHAFVVLRDDRVAGFFSGYTRASLEQEQAATQKRTIDFLGWHFCRRFFALRTVSRAMGDPGEQEYLISNIAVYPEFRQMGAGSLLIQKAVREAEQQQCTRIVLDVLSTNTTAIRFYESLGFTAARERPLFRLDGQEFRFCQMVYPIGPDPLDSADTV